jgi:UDP-GlcNAc:undecaprenyl-phosphate GlcNAc-1-phosphate transferase
LEYLILCATAFFLCLILTALFMAASRKWRILIHGGVPLVGGLGLYLSFALVTALAIMLYRGLIPRESGVIVAASSLMFALGIVDDWRELSVGKKLLAQLAACALLAALGIRAHIIYLPEALNILVTFIWVIALANAFNHLDVCDGVAAGAAAIVSAAFFAVALFSGDFSLAALAATLLGTVLGFLAYNYPPAKAYLGNSGSHFLGFALAALALCISYAPGGRWQALFTPILIMGFPIFDTAFLILARLKKKQMIYKKSNDHLVLRFLSSGLPKEKAMLLMLGLAAFYSLCGIVFYLSRGAGAAGVFCAVLAASWLVTRRMSRVKVDA